MKIFPIRLELLRTGDAENQLLSPLTPYLALCGDRPAEVVHVPFVHGEFLDLHSRLRYSKGPAAAVAAAAEMALALHSFLGSITNLREEMASAESADVVELRLVLSASELALLPFELIAVPGSLPSSKSLFSKPMVILRQSRRRAQKLNGWPDWPRILFVTSQAGGVVPAKSHLVALQSAIQPFLPYALDQYDEAQGQKYWLGDHIDLLTDASLEEIRKQCEKQRYTHVHILAHGGEDGPSWAPRFGLLLTSSDGRGKDLVHGGELSNALQATPGFPTVVTLASCDGGNQGNVLEPGGSLAQELHMAGIPLVAASQFPLTFRGSAAMVEQLYTGMVQGQDPRQVLVKTRTAMMAASPPQALDWASLVAYTSPADTFPRQVQVAQRRVAKRQIDALIVQLGAGVEMRGAPARTFDTYEALQAHRARLQDMQNEYLEASTTRSHRADALRFIASSEKRWAEAIAFLFLEEQNRLTSEPEKGPSELQKGLREKGKRERYHREQLAVPLRRAKDAYRESFSLSTTGGPVALVQSQALAAMLGHGLDPDDVKQTQWLLGMIPKRQRDAEWYRTMLELDLLLLGKNHECCDQDQACLLRGMFEEPNAAWEAYSLFRQLRRYEIFFEKRLRDLMVGAMSAKDEPAPGDEGAGRRHRYRDELGEHLPGRVARLQRELQLRGVRESWEPSAMWGMAPGALPTSSVR